MSKLTLVTCLYDLVRREGSAWRQIEDYFRFGEFVLGLDQDIVFFTDPDLAVRIQERRRSLGYEHRTRIIPLPLEDLGCAKYLPQIRKARPGKNWSPQKETPSYALLTWSKLEMIERVAATDPFGSSHLGWIDFGLAHVAKTTPPASTEPFSNPSDAIRFHVLRYFGERTVQSADYWDYVQGHLAAGFFQGSKENMRELASSFWPVVETALANNYRPNEEGILPCIIARDPRKFSFSYGDYTDILLNHVKMRRGGEHLLWQMRDARERGVWPHGLAIGRQMMAAHSEGIFTAYEEVTEGMLLEYCIAASNGPSKDEARKAASYYVRQVERVPYFRSIYLRHQDLVDKTFSAIDHPLPLQGTRIMSEGQEIFENIPTHKADHNGPRELPSVVLVSMVKNESKVILRMLDSAAAVASHFCVVDTGSTDGTVDIVREWAKNHGVPLVVYSTPFVDFGATRTASLQKAVEWTRKLSLNLDKTYLLLVDADMTIESRGFDRAQLKDDNYRLLQDAGTLAYYNTRLVRSSKVRGYKGRTHEYLETAGNVGDLHTLVIKDLGDGGCKADKFERDIRLLTKDLEENPNNARSMYYLGASYEAVGKLAEAIEMYTKRSTFPNAWEEEAWMALYRRGIAKELSNDLQGATQDYKDAWIRRPWRAEPLAKLANLALNQKQHQKACALAKAGISIPYPAGDSLFIEKRCYNEEFHRLLAIADYYTGNKYDGMAHCDHLILNPSNHHYNALQNAVWYMSPLKVSRRIDLGEMFKEHIPPGFHPCNPSLIRHFDRRKGAFRYVMSLRMVNFWINADGSYGFSGPGQTRTLRCELNHELEKISVGELENPQPEPDSRIFGIEDVRLYQDRLVDDYTYAVGIRLDGVEKKPQIYNCIWADNKLVSCIRISDPGRTEKNWLPIMNRIAEDYRMPVGPNLLYSTGPDLVKIRPATGIYYQRRPSIDTHDFRGGSNVVPYLGGWLWVIHQVAILPQQTKRKYLHRLCWSRGDHDGPTADGFRTSPPFCFEKAQIEFCSGACLGPDGSLLLTYGIEDARAYLVEIDENTVASMLKI